MLISALKWLKFARSRALTISPAPCSELCKVGFFESCKFVLNNPLSGFPRPPPQVHPTPLIDGPKKIHIAWRKCKMFFVTLSLKWHNFFHALLLSWSVLLPGHSVTSGTHCLQPYTWLSWSLLGMRMLDTKAAVGKCHSLIFVNIVIHTGDNWTG